MRHGQPHITLEADGRALRLGIRSVELDRGKDALGAYRWSYLHHDGDRDLAIKMLTARIANLLEPRVPAAHRHAPFVAHTFTEQDTYSIMRHYRLVRVPYYDTNGDLTSIANYVAEYNDHIIEDEWWAFTELDEYHHGCAKSDALTALARAYMTLADMTLADQAGILVIQTGG